LKDAPSPGAAMARNYFFVFLSQLVRLGATVAVFVVIARNYGPTAFGQFTTAHTLSALFILFADFGFDTLLASEIARHRDRASDLAHTYLSMKFIFALCSSVAMVLVARFRGLGPETISLIDVFSLYVFFSALTNFFFALFKSFEEMHHEVRISFLMNLYLFVVVLALGIVHVAIFWLAVAFVSSRLLGGILSLPTVQRLVQFRPSKLRLATRREFRGISIFGFSTISGFLFFTADTLMLAWLTGDHEVGVYQAAIKIVGLSLLVSDIAFYSMLPVLNRYHAESTNQWVSIIRILHKFLSATGVVIGFLIFVLAEPLISVVFGLRGFQATVPILRLFGITVFVRYFGEASATSLTTSHKVIRRLVVMGGGVVLNIGLNLYAIPHFGAWGACVVSLVTNIAIVLGYVIASAPESAQWLLAPRNYSGISLAVVCGWIPFSVTGTLQVPATIVCTALVITVCYFGIFERRDRQRLIGALIEAVNRSSYH
jgi:O-antigen/teichoic acid export membrane protein